MEYVRKLLVDGARAGKTVTEKDIGVVTPYKLQSKVIARACRRSSFNDITVGTAEVFQGQEKPVMIVSTVCTNGTLGFVKDPRVGQYFDSKVSFFSICKTDLALNFAYLIPENECHHNPCQKSLNHRW